MYMNRTQHLPRPAALEQHPSAEGRWKRHPELSVEDVLAAFRSVMVDARRDNGTWVCIGLDGRGCNQLT